MTIKQRLALGIGGPIAAITAGVSLVWLATYLWFWAYFSTGAGPAWLATTLAAQVLAALIAVAAFMVAVAGSISMVASAITDDGATL